MRTGKRSTAITCKKGTHDGLWRWADYRQALEDRERVRLFWMPGVNVRFKPLERPTGKEER